MGTARLRVFLVTYRRPKLLRRALRSLLEQTFTDWVCELHNDAPDDESPRAVLEEIAPGDARFEYHHHETNLGPVGTFNLVFAGGPEPFASLLEDDNWWEPRLLETLVATMDSHPQASLAWSNMQLWHEQADGNWRDSGHAVWPQPEDPDTVVEFSKPEVLQAFDALHSNGAMVFRPDRFDARGVPPAAPFAIIESLRERAATGPLLFVPRVLAHFGSTRTSARNPDPAAWVQAKLLCGTSFFEHARVGRRELEEIWTARRSQLPPDTDIFFLLALTLRNPALLSPCTAADWLRFLLHSARHPGRLARALRFRTDHADVWAWLRQRTAGVRNARLTFPSKARFTGAPAAPEPTSA